VLAFGAGGTDVEVHHDRCVSFPPINQFLAQRLVEQTHVARLLVASRDRPAANIEALWQVLRRVSELVTEVPQIQELEINPLMADAEGVVALGARVRVEPAPMRLERYGHMAIHPYPSHLVSRYQLADGTDIVIRPIRPEDAEIERQFVRDLSPRARYFRFMHTLRELTAEMLVRFTQIDYDRELALIAVTQVGGAEVEIGVTRYVTNPDGASCEFAIVVADAWQGKGIGSRLLQGLMEAASIKGLRKMDGEVLENNQPMLALMGKLGFTIYPHAVDVCLRTVSKSL
jgi:acetyltransferase